MATTTVKPVKNAGKISGSTLKIIAMACMLIDHTAAVLFDRILISRGLLNAVNASDGGASFLSTGNTAVIYYADMIMRAIGRISFPIFCFLLIEGFKRNRLKRCICMMLHFSLFFFICSDHLFH